LVRETPSPPKAFAAYGVTSILFVALILSKGPPAVQHDWLFPMSTNAFVQRMFDLGMGWSVNGLGQPNPYPMTYFVVWPLALAALVVGAHVALCMLVVAVAAAVNYAGYRIARSAELPAPNGAIIGAFLLFNPWTYEKIVAGHLTQTIAFAGLAALLADLIAGNASRKQLASATILTALQTQFFLIAALALVLSIRQSRSRYALLVGLLVFSPSLLGIALDERDLLNWPFTVAWEKYQSVPMLHGIELQGFFSEPAFALPIGFALQVIVVAVFFGLIGARRRAVYIAAAIGAASLLFASGTIGPFGGLWRWGIVHVPFVGVYRELYDVIGLTAASYGIVLAYVMKRWRAVTGIVAVASAALAAAWLVTPPSRYWVSADSLPPFSQRLAQVERYALMPPFQPLTFNGSGSGADTAYIGQSADNAPANALLPTFPVIAALGRYARDADASSLAKLGVSLVDCRRGFAESQAAVLYYGKGLGPRFCGKEVEIQHPAPIVGLAPRADLCSVCANAGAGAMFFGDAPRRSNEFMPVATPRVDVNPQEDWIDVRLLFASMPELGEPLGGAYTTQSTIPLKVPTGRYLLVNVRGILTDDANRPVAQSTDGYKWIRKPNGTDASLICRGQCVVVGASERPEGPPQAPPVPVKPLSFRRPFAAIVAVALPAGTSGVLRFLENYDAGWIGVRWPSLQVTRHVRLDAALNGWYVKQESGSDYLILIEATSIAQFLAGVAGIATIFLVIFGAQPDKEAVPAFPNELSL
jgi:hypothetical protein